MEGALVDGADDAGRHVAVAVDDKAAGDGGAGDDGPERQERRAGGVEHARVGDLKISHERAGTGEAVAGVDTDELDALAGGRVGDADETGRFGAARPAQEPHTLMTTI